MGSIYRYSERFCEAKYACDGATTLAKDGVCQKCKARRDRERTAKREYERYLREVTKHPPNVWPVDP